MALTNGSRISINVIDWGAELGLSLVQSLFSGYICKVANTAYPDGAVIPDNVPKDSRGNAFTDHLRFTFTGAQIPLDEFPDCLSLGNLGYQAVYQLASNQPTVNQPNSDSTQMILDKLNWATETVNADGESARGRQLLSSNPEDHPYVVYQKANKFDTVQGRFTDEVRHNIDDPNPESFDGAGKSNNDAMPARTSIIYRPAFQSQSTRMKVEGSKVDFSKIVTASA